MPLRGAGEARADRGSMASGSRLNRLTGYLYHELMFWHNAGHFGSVKRRIQPARHVEHSETKRRLHNLVAVSGLMDQLALLAPRAATAAELSRVHDRSYVDRIAALSDDHSKGIHRVGDESGFAPGGYEIAALSAGGAIVATDEVLAGNVANAYALCRPPGHHAERGTGLGYCIFNNVSVAAAHAMERHGLSRVAIVDFDVHHGNGTQEIFAEDERVLFVSVHQDGNYPLASGSVDEVGSGPGEGFTLNVPLPPGSGSGAYRAAFDRVVGPALDAFRPQLILVSAGYDAGYMDPLGQMMCSSEDFRYFMAVLKAAAERHCAGRLVAVHEGGYSEVYVPFCGLAAIEQLAGLRSKVTDPYLPDVQGFGWQALQPHQDAVLVRCEANVRRLAARLDGARRNGAAARR
ncbi:MAG: histone deacetylase [Monoraphidium minutum]|nr:MAG: histone deacetylase [Monoraphidium minutum]